MQIQTKSNYKIFLTPNQLVSLNYYLFADILNIIIELNSKSLYDVAIFYKRKYVTANTKVTIFEERDICLGRYVCATAI